MADRLIRAGPSAGCASSPPTRPPFDAINPSNGRLIWTLSRHVSTKHQQTYHELIPRLSDQPREYVRLESRFDLVRSTNEYTMEELANL